MREEVSKIEKRRTKNQLNEKLILQMKTISAKLEQD
jgi:hypothetical protein